MSQHQQGAVPAKEIDLHYVIGFILGNRLWLLLGLFLGVMGGAFYSLIQTPLYKSNTTLQYIEAKKSANQMEAMFDFNKSSGPEVAIPVLQSRSLAEDVVRRLALNAHLENVSDLGFVKSLQRRVRGIINPPDSLTYQGITGKTRFYLAKLLGDPGPVGSLVLRDLSVDAAVNSYQLTLRLLPDSSGLKVLDTNQQLLAQCQISQPCRVVFPKGSVSFVAEEINAGYDTTMIMSFRSLEAAASMVRGGIEANMQNKIGKLLSVDCTWADPHQAVLILKALTEAYDARERQSITRSYDQMLDFLDKSLAPTQGALEQAERELRAFLAAHKMFDMKLQYEQGAQSITKFDQQQIIEELEKRQLAYLGDMLGKANANAYGPLISNVSPTLADQWRQLQEKSIELEIEGKTLDGYTEEYPAKKRHFLALKMLEQRKEDLKKKALQAIRDKQAILAENAKLLDHASAKVQKGMGLEAETQIEFMRLARNKEIAEKLYGAMQTKREEMRLAKAGEITSMQVLDSPLRGVQVSPNLSRSTAVGAFMGLLLAGFIAFLRETLDIAIKDPSEIERLTGLYVHGMIPLHKEGIDNESLVTITRPTSIEAEAYRSLRTSIQLASLENKVTSIMITSSGPGEGKSTTMSNLAVTLAQAGRKTLIVDCDMRRPIVDKLFGIEREPGLSEVLTDKLAWRDYVRPTAVEGLFVLPSGKIPMNPSELVGRSYMATILAEMKEEYDFVLCDVPPILVVSDAALLASHLDGVLILVRSGVAVGHEVARAREQMERVGGRVLGGIFNAYDNKSGGYGYSRYSYSSYHHEEGDAGAMGAPANRLQHYMSGVGMVWQKLLSKLGSGPR